MVCDGTIEEDILRKANEKRAIDHKAIQAGMFNQRSTAEERNSILKEILARDDDRLGSNLPNDEEINIMIARSDEEVELFEEMDRERERADNKKHPGRSRLMEYHEIPKEVRDRDVASVEIKPGCQEPKVVSTKRLKVQDMVENVPSSEDDGEGGRRRRRRSAAREPKRYDDGLTETAFLRVLQKGAARGTSPRRASVSWRRAKTEARARQERDARGGGRGGGGDDDDSGWRRTKAAKRVATAAAAAAAAGEGDEEAGRGGRSGRDGDGPRARR